MEKNDSKGAIVLFDEAIAAYPNFAPAYHQKGTAYLKENELDKALESFVKAISIKPDYFEAKFSVGYTQYLKKNYEVAAAVFDDVLKQQADMPEAQMYLGISLFNLKNVDAAETILKKTVAAKSGERLALAHLYLGQIYAQKKKNAEAAAELEKYLELLPKAELADRAVRNGALAVVAAAGGRLHLLVPLLAQRRELPLGARLRKLVGLRGSLGEGHGRVMLAPISTIRRRGPSRNAHPR